MLGDTSRGNTWEALKMLPAGEGTDVCWGQGLAGTEGSLEWGP